MLVLHGHWRLKAKCMRLSGYLEYKALTNLIHSDSLHSYRACIYSHKSVYIIIYIYYAIPLKYTLPYSAANSGPIMHDVYIRRDS